MLLSQRGSSPSSEIFLKQLSITILLAKRMLRGIVRPALCLANGWER